MGLNFKLKYMLDFLTSFPLFIKQGVELKSAPKFANFVLNLVISTCGTWNAEWICKGFSCANNPGSYL